MTKQTLTTVSFHGAKLIAIEGDSPESTLVAMKPIVEGMGLGWEPQRRKLSEHHFLSTCTTILEVQMPADDQKREHAFLPLNRLPMWLVTIQPNKVPDPATRARVIEYQTEAADVLFNHFFGKALASGPHLDARATGGIVKSVLGKAMADMEQRLDAMVAQRVAVLMESYDPTGGFTTDYAPIRRFIDEAVPNPKGRGALTRRAAIRCRKWLIASKKGGMMRVSRETDRILFHVDAAKEWMAAEGALLVRAHLDKMAGQTVMRLVVPPRRPTGEGEGA